MTRPGMMGGAADSQGNPNARATQFGPSVRRLATRLAPYKRAIGAVLLFIVTAVSLNAIGPRILGHGTDIIFNGVIGKQLPTGVTQAQAVEQLRAAGQDTFADMVSGMNLIPGVGVDFGALARVMYLALAVYLIAATCAWASAYILNNVVQSVIRGLRSDVEDKVHRLPLSYFDKHQRGDVLSRVTNDIDNVSQSLQQTMSQLLNALLTVLAVLAMMLWISPLLALIALLTVPLSLLVTAIIVKRAQPHYAGQWRHTGLLNAHVEETHTGHELVLAYGRERDVQNTFDERNGKLQTSAFKAQFLSGMVMPVIMFLGNINYVLVAVVGGMRVASGNMSLGEVQAFIQYSRQFTQPLSQLASMVNVLQSGVASAERVFELLDAEEETADVTNPDLPASRGRVEFDDVSFRYDSDRPLIDNLSLTVEPGQMVAIVGPTGAGKTTLVNLLMRFYEVDSGAIRIDGVDIRRMPRAELRTRIGMVLQDTWLFGGTIADNIRYGAIDASEESVSQAAKDSYVDRFARALPDGYDTIIDEESGNVSIGEQQLITIARAFVSQPHILILDEATSSVDTRTELLIQKAMSRLRADRTAFVIAHRLSTIRDADVILVMEDGHIVETGSHDELIAADGPYRALYMSQFAGAST
ncbi:ABC transporter ATP-binding protein [Hoyosella rhizosphaerae]|uniref:Fatty acid ABC transporter ATP-binding/permease protein n=1 Tax=Hoyosella rhizosphaerae TaxID=1755582 RepID=A0A916U1E5_9ACTN|nr:ABC transporter ATP-binding protein [Hoyosella rhizosphaerae]MBN4927239.1 ABC transporter ATP-binding protein [Hoyosella rhizosphaerae]GGC52850.1 multidrug ABC transporter ATP-binding protein [Hoyosella rhizosphaerae]